MTDATPGPVTQGPAPKPGILDIAPYVGGKSSIAGVAEPMKLSSNENMLGAGEKARAAYEAAIKNIHIYPDGRATKLRNAVSELHGLQPERLIFGNGSDEVFALLNQTYLTAGDNIVCGQYGFLAYRISALGCEAQVKLAPEPNFKAEVDALLAQVDDRTKIVYVSNPSNPTGSYNTGEEIRRLHAALPAHVILVVDEAYAEYVTEADWETAFPLAKDAENIVVTRTFSKIHGLGGLRIGFGYAPLKVAEAIDRIRLPFNVSVPGLEAATAALSDEAHQTASRDLISNWKPRLTQALRGFGLNVLPSAGNFVLVLFDGAERAAAANDYLNSKGIIVRPVGGYGLPQALRITIGTEDQNRAVIDALSEFAAT
ncbi:histidinol-phosphate transaminase [Brevundimonas fontaquae]|uniref:Histidinol-phosphate aminotransferase n=1 Tax=Brevundimonas fontaquae TaxID=2813778 RepID=A0ABX7LTH9_9CAUL|nr:histidinol-phosphate transaminase [Brevundimonas fontaquae]QSF55050.1 histidinol-phosphate transaminase [Brevundimonas fontaquae]